MTEFMRTIVGLRCHVPRLRGRERPRRLRARGARRRHHLHEERHQRGRRGGLRLGDRRAAALDVQIGAVRLGKKLVEVMSITRQPPFALVVNPKASGTLTTVAGLQGKKVAVQNIGSGDYLLGWGGRIRTFDLADPESADRLGSTNR